MDRSAVFVEFTTTDIPPKKHFFVGDSLESILKDTNSGTGFAFSRYLSHKLVEEVEVRALNLSCYRHGVMCD